jgi:hypothetical protein
MYSSNMFNGLFEGIFTQPSAPASSYAWLNQPSGTQPSASTRSAVDLPPLAPPTPVPVAPAAATSTTPPAPHPYTYANLDPNAPPLSDIMFGFGEYPQASSAYGQTVANHNGATAAQPRTGSYDRSPPQLVYNQPEYAEPEPTQLELDQYSRVPSLNLSSAFDLLCSVILLDDVLATNAHHTPTDFQPAWEAALPPRSYARLRRVVRPHTTRSNIH